MTEPISEVQPASTDCEDLKPVLLDSHMALLLGEFNTEAKCAAYLATPDAGLTSTTTIKENLAVNGAFGMVSPTTFNVQGILKNMSDVLVMTASDPHGNNGRGETWAEKPTKEVTEFADGFAGSLLDFSLANNIALRRIIGEKRRGGKPQDPGSTEIRLATLTTLALKHEETGGVFSQEEVEQFVVDEFKITPISVARHISKLRKAGFIADSRRGKSMIELATFPDERSAHEIIMNLLIIVGGFAIGSIPAIEHGRSRGRQIMADEKTLPILIKRSFAHSTHTGKKTPHKG